MYDHISGGRWDGREWPPAGGEIDVPDWEGRDLITGRLAVLAQEQRARSMTEGEPEPPSAPPEPPPPEAPPAEETQVSAVTGVSPLAETSMTSAGAPAGAGEMPRPQDAKQAWIDWAVASGADPEQAAAMTKADLMSRYGGRL
jgi:hypothetical protein